MTSGAAAAKVSVMPCFLLHHRHDPETCEPAFAAWQGFPSPLRHRVADSTCLAGDHDIWWRVEASDRQAALALLPAFVAKRTCAILVRGVRIP